MRARRYCLMLVVVGAACGCTHRQLNRSAVDTTGTVMDIQYRSVLANLAMLSAHPEGLPNHVHLADGVVQINDELGFGGAGGFTTFGGTDFGIDQFGPAGSRQITEQWGTDATTDPERLTDLQALYRAALGLPQLPPPNAIAFLRRPQEEQGKKGGSPSGSGSSGSSSGGSSGPASTTSTGGGGSTPSSGGSSGGDGDRQVPLDVLLTDVPPPGWYHVGCRKDVPKDACYVGRWGGRYAWVTADGVPHLSRFTVTVLAVIKLKPGEGGGGKRGLAVTR